MRVVIMSDIHGNLAALQAVESSLPPRDRVIVAGDLCLDGPRPAEVVDMLRALGWELLMGNTDRDVVDMPAGDKHEALLRWTRDQLGAERLRLLADLPFSILVEDGGPVAHVVHANPLTMDDHLAPTMSEDELRPYLDAARAPLLAFGHLHIPYVRPVAETLLVDVSSVGHPKDRDQRAAYTVVEWDGERRSVSQIRVPYDIERTLHGFRTCGMPDAEEHAKALLKASY